MTRQTTSDDQHRTAVDLTGPWEFVTDPEDEGVDDGWYRPEAAWPDRAVTVEVPHAWQERAEFREYTGTAWYRRTVDPAAAVDRDRLGEDRRLRLAFDAVDYEATVWVDGERAGSNRGGYLPFEVDVTEAVAAADGEVEVVVAVTDPEDLSELPHGKQGAPWYQRVSGIWQAVSLEAVPTARVETVRATPDLDADAVHVAIETAGLDGPATASVAVSREGEEAATAEAEIEGGEGTVTIDLEDPDYWSPEDPALYDLTVDLLRDGRTLDRYEDYFGMRSIEARDGRLYLNGDPLYVRGALDQGYYPETLYRPFDDDLFEREIRAAKEMGFNLLRKHIKPAHPAFLEAADRLGILVWEEPANPTVASERSKREVREQVEGLIDRDYNRPSVVIWSLYNEEWGLGNPQGLDEETSLWDDPEKQAYLADLYRETRERDPTRLVCDNSGWAHVATDLNDYHRYFVAPDRAGPWSDDVDAIVDAPEDNYAAEETDPAEAPIVLSEFGTWGLPDLPAVEAHYDGEPPWFDYEFFDDPIKRPAGVHDRFAETGLDEVFDGWAALAEAWQRREFRSIAHVIERLRSEPAVAGYVITEFSDIEWEFNGMLDYRREPKSFVEDLPRVNGEVLLRAAPETRALAAGEELVADVVVVTDGTDPIEGEVTWSVFGESGTVAVDLDGPGVQRVEEAIRVRAPDVDAPTTADLSLSHPTAPENAAELAVVPEPSADADLAVYADDPVAGALADAGFEVVDALAAADVAVVADPDDAVEAYVAEGGTALRVPSADGHMAEDPFFEYRALPEDESWNLVASLLYAEDGPLSAYVDDVPGWEFEGLYPYEVVDDPADHEVHVGYVEGWLANWSAAAAVREYGDGRVGAFTFRVTGTDQPVGLAALADLLVDLGES